MEAKELSMAIENATAMVAMDANADQDHLYVPGNVILMYNEWSKRLQEKQEEESRLSPPGGDDDQEGKDGQGCPEYVADQAVVCDGTAKALQYIEFDSRMLDDHMTQDYKDSIRSVTSSLSREVP
jgi:hypothetical protein